MKKPSPKATPKVLGRSSPIVSKQARLRGAASVPVVPKVTIKSDVLEKSDPKFFESNLMTASFHWKQTNLPYLVCCIMPELESDVIERQLLKSKRREQYENKNGMDSDNKKAEKKENDNDNNKLIIGGRWGGTGAKAFSKKEPKGAKIIDIAPSASLECEVGMRSSSSSSKEE